MAAIFWQVKDLPICEPGELRRKLVTFAQRRRDTHRKVIFKDTGYFAFESAQVVDIGDNPFTRLAGNRCNQGHSAGRHVGYLARKLTSVGKHIAAKQVDPHALVAATFRSQRQNHRFGQWQGHGYISRNAFSATVEPMSLSLTMG